MHLMIYMYSVPFGDTKVSSASILPPAQANAFLQSKASQSWLKPYKWVRLKKKKLFAVARPIIHFLQQLYLWQVV